jgi:sugar fermentation stimulation protein A
MGDPVEAHLPDPGRLRELLVPGRRVLLAAAANPERRTRWTLVLVQTPAGDGWVSLDTTVPNRLLARHFQETEARGEDPLAELPGWRPGRAEVTVGASRFDFVMVRGEAEGEGRDTLILEAKSVTLVEDRLALFPDAVTARGTRHVQEMAALARGGHPAAVIFVAQRSDVDAIEAAWAIDPDFSEALDEAREAGVVVFGRCCRVTPEGIALGDAVPVR